MPRFGPPSGGNTRRLEILVLGLMMTISVPLFLLVMSAWGSDITYWVATGSDSVDAADISPMIRQSADDDSSPVSSSDAETLAASAGRGSQPSVGGTAAPVATSAAGKADTTEPDQSNTVAVGGPSEPQSGATGSDPVAVEPPASVLSQVPLTTNTTIPSTVAPMSTAPVAPVSTAPVSTVPTSKRTAETSHSHNDPTMVTVAADVLAALRNDNPLFNRFRNVPSDQLSINALTESAPRPDNGTVGDGQFRVACQYSHFNYDDPIVFPGRPGKSHLHMFFGNTDTDAHTTTEQLVNSGGGTCNGFELNRSAYWMPALLDGKGNAVVPEKIILYYKTKFPGQVAPLPQGLKMIAGSTGGSFEVSNQLFWSCGSNGHAYNKTNRVPDCGGDVINASVVFPECWDGVNLDSADHRSHLKAVDAVRPCPVSHPVRLPQISILVYFPGQSSVDGWHLSADMHHAGSPPGGALHADWFGGWNDDAVNLWSNGCMVRARNCSLGQTGTDRQLARLNSLQNFPGPYILDLSP